MSRMGRTAAWLRDYSRDTSYGIVRKVRHAISPSAAWTASETTSDGALPPVLLLPGVYETWEFLHPIADHLTARGYPVHVVPGFGSNRGSIPSMAARAQAYLDAVGLERVVIVAHSKGGLIGKHMMVVDDTRGRIDRVIAVNTPFSGSMLARYTLRRTLREFSPLGATISALAAERAVNARITSIFSRSDPIIPGGSALEGARNVRLRSFGHFQVLSSRELFEVLDRELAHPGDRRLGDRTSGHNGDMTETPQ